MELLTQIYEALNHYRNRWGHRPGGILLDADTYFKVALWCQEFSSVYNPPGAGESRYIQDIEGVPITIHPTATETVILPLHPGSPKEQSLLVLASTPPVFSESDPFD